MKGFIKMKFNTVKMSFAAEVSAEDMLKILSKDNKSLRSRNGGQTLHDMLSSIDGVEYIEYDGHFGPNLFIGIDEPVKAKDVLERVKTLIESYLS